MQDLGFDNKQFKDMIEEYDMTSFEETCIEGHMISRRTM